MISHSITNIIKMLQQIKLCLWHKQWKQWLETDWGRWGGGQGWEMQEIRHEDSSMKSWIIALETWGVEGHRKRRTKKYNGKSEPQTEPTMRNQERTWAEEDKQMTGTGSRGWCHGPWEGWRMWERNFLSAWETAWFVTSAPRHSSVAPPPLIWGLSSERIPPYLALPEKVHNLRAVSVCKVKPPWEWIGAQNCGMSSFSILCREEMRQQNFGKGNQQNTFEPEKNGELYM